MDLKIDTKDFDFGDEELKLDLGPALKVRNPRGNFTFLKMS